VSLLLPVLRFPDVMLRLSFIAFALSLLATIDAVAQQQRPTPATNPPPPSMTLEQAIAMARANEPVLEVVDAENSLTAAEIAREDGTVRYQLALTNLQLLTGAI
jgi:hypothetical protein